MLPTKKGETVSIDKNNLNLLVNWLKDFQPEYLREPFGYERRSASIFIYGLFAIGKAESILITFRDSPDFYAEINGVKCGIEHVRATNENYMAAIAELKKRPVGSVVEPSCFKPDGGLVKKNRNKSIAEPGKRLFGPGDFDTKIDWAKYIYYSILEKTKLLNKNYDLFEKNILLIDDELPCWFTEFEQAREYLLKEIKAGDWIIFKNLFDEVHVHRGGNLLYDILNKFCLVNCSKANLKSV